MSFTDFVTGHGQKVRRDHFIHLVQVAEIDGKIDPIEMELLHKEGKKFGLTDPEIDSLIDKEKDFHYVPPYSLQEKFDQLYNIAVIILADDEVTESEKKMIRRYAIAAGFDDNIIEMLIDLLLGGIKKGEDEETLLSQFKKKLRG
jgi:hypothetical protein